MDQKEEPEESPEEPKARADKDSIAIGKIEIGGNIEGNLTIGHTTYQYASEEDVPLTSEELENGLTRLAGYLPERAPVLLDQFSSIAKKLRATLGAELNALSPTLKKQREENLEAVKSVCMEVLDISFRALCTGQNPPAYDTRTPFRGLESFRPEDSEFFFGREELVNKVVQRTEKHPFLAVLGIPGSGKSSLVMAGVVPAVGDEHVIFRPGAEAQKSLESALALTKENTLLVVDQFEELFTLNKAGETRENFIARLMEQVGRLRIILTMRADFIGEVALYPKLKEQVEANQIIISPMNSEELRQSMQGQAAVVGLRFESNLVQQILDDVAGEPGAMPLLQHALWTLWKRRHGTWLKVDEYTAFGGVKQAIARTADDVFASCSDLERLQLRDIFLRLTRLDEDSDGRDTRRRVLLQELVPAGSDPSTTASLLNKLIDARLLVKNAVRNESEVEVAHEALIQEWPTLRDWLTQDRQGLIIHQQLSEDTNDWLKLKRDPGSLYRGARLQQALEWAETNQGLLNATERDFLDASREIAEEEKNQVRRLGRARSTQRVLTGATTLLVALVVVIVLAVNGVFAPREMDGAFNIAVAEFGEMRADGKIYPSKAGQTLSGWAVDHLRTQIEDPTIQIWPNQGNMFNRTNVDLAGPDTASALASDINASLLLYGYIDTRQNPPELVLKFWIAPQAGYEFEEIQGSYGVGKPIRIVDMNNPGTGSLDELKRQSTAIAWVGIGLTNQQLGQSSDALNAFLKAQEAMPDSAMVQFFIGREHLFTFEKNPEIQQTEWQTAEDAFRKAITNDDTFARAYIGLGSTYFLRSAALAQSALTSGQAIDPKADEWIEAAIQNYGQVLNLKPDPAEYGNPVEDVARLSLGNAYRLKGSIALIRGDVPAALEALNQSIQALDQVRPAFEASVPQHESHRRYLTLTYEYLGEAYQWKGAALEGQDQGQAVESYNKSIDYYNQCIAQGEASYDLAIHDDIINANCQPKLQEVKTRYDVFTGVKP